MKKMRKLIAVAALAVSVFTLTACGTKKPNGTYSNGTTYFDFAKDDVIIKDGYTQDPLSFKYDIDSNGNITIDPTGENITATYDSEKDSIECGSTEYRKSAR